MNTRTLTAVALSLLFLMAWFRWMSPVPARRDGSAVAQGVVSPATPALTAPPPVTGRPLSRSAEPPETLLDVRRGAWTISFSPTHGGVIRWILHEKMGDVELVNSQEPVLTTLDIEVDGAPLVATGRLVRGPEDSGEVAWEGAAGPLRLRWTLALPASGYLAAINLEVTNPGRKPVRLDHLRMGWGPGLGTVASELKENDKNLRAILLGGDAKLSAAPKPGSQPMPVRWVGVDNRYFLVALLPGDGWNSAVVLGSKEKTSAVALSLEGSVAPGASRRATARVFVGPKGYDSLRRLGLDLERAVDFGWFGEIGKGMLWTLSRLHGMTHNYGWAIILLTIGLQALMFPLSMKTFSSMASMKKLQPLMTQIREKFKDDPKRMNAELMELYKRHKVNPFGGCLPMILQIPVFWALFTTLRNAVELRSAPFFGWITDLSTPDTLVTVSGVGVHVLPLLMGVAMFAQQKLTTADPEQAKMMMFMPVMFTFIFWSFPSGLVLYWLVNSLVTISEQLWMTRRAAHAGSAGN